MSLPKDAITRIEDFIREETEDLADADYVEWLEEVEDRVQSARIAKQEEMQ